MNQRLSAALTSRDAVRHCRGFTLVELAIVMGIIAVLALIALPLYADVTDKARIAKAVADIRILEGEIQAYETVNGSIPVSLDQLNVGGLKDPWGNPYEYLNFAAAGPRANGLRRKDRFLVPLNTTYDLYSKGKDGQSQPALTARASRDDIIRANDGGYVGLGSEF